MLKSVQRLRARHPHTVPVMVEPDSNFMARLSSRAAEAAKTALACPRFAVPRDWTVTQLQARLRANMQLASKHALYLFIRPVRGGHVLACSATTVGALHDEYRDEATGMLWVTLALESTFGAHSK